MDFKFLHEVEAKTDQLKAFVALQHMTLDPSAQPRDLRRDPQLKEIISRHDHQLVLLKRIHDATGHAYTKLQRQRDTLASAISPAMLCPPEILIEIFEHVLSFDQLGYPLESNARQVLDISHVCGKWRTSVLSHSEFWTCIPTWWDDQLQELFATHSQNKPLHVFATRDDEALSNPPREALIHASHRWKSFTTDISSGEDAFVDLQKIGDLSALNRITIIHDPAAGYAGHIYVNMSHFSSPLPSLSSLSFAHFSSACIEAVSELLTNLDLASTPFDYGDWLALPVFCPHLEALSIGSQDMCNDIDLDTTDLEPVIFPKLQKLTVRSGCDITFQWFIFHSVRAPQLRHLSISLSNRPDLSVARDIQTQMRNDELRPFLQALPLVEKLTLSDDVTVVKEVVALLSFPSTSSLFCLPNLKDLRIFQLNRSSSSSYESNLGFGLRNLLLRRGQSATVDLDEDSTKQPPPVLRKLVLVLATRIDPAHRAWLEGRVGEMVTPLCPVSRQDEDVAFDLNDW